MNTTESLFLSFEGDHPIRIAGTPDALLFVAADVCAVLGLQYSSQAVATLDPDEQTLYKVLTRSETGVEQRREMLCVTESGLYHLIFKSRKATAKRFRRWVTEEVLPEIRRNGSYLHASQADPFESLLLSLGTEMEDAIAASDIAHHRIRTVAAKRNEVIDRVRAAAPYDVTETGAIVPTPFRVDAMPHAKLVDLIAERFDISKPRAMGVISKWILTNRAVLHGKDIITIP